MIRGSREGGVAWTSRRFDGLNWAVLFNTDRTRECLACWGSCLAWLIFLGYAAIPLACLFGIVKLPPGVTP